jgi:hypothetical protein
MQKISIIVCLSRSWQLQDDINIASHLKNSDNMFVLHVLFDNDIYIKKSNEIRMLVHIKEISKKKNKTDFSQHFCTNVFTAVADLQVQCL